MSAEQAIGGDGVDVAFAGDDALRRTTCSRHFDAGLALASRDQLEVVGDEGIAVPRRPVALPHAR